MLLDRLEKVKGSAADMGGSGGGSGGTMKRLSRTTMGRSKKGGLKVGGAYNTHKKHLSKRGVKEAGGFGNDFIDYALTAPPKHMPLVKTSAFLSDMGGAAGGAKRGVPAAWAKKKVAAETGGGGGEEDSLAVSAAAASDAPPGERELGTLLDKKIKFMERNSERQQRPASAKGVPSAFGSMRGSGVIRKPPRSKTRPKSATLKRLPPKTKFY